MINVTTGRVVDETSVESRCDTR